MKMGSSLCFSELNDIESCTILSLMLMLSVSMLAGPRPVLDLDGANIVNCSNDKKGKKKSPSVSIYFFLSECFILTNTQIMQ